MPALATRVPNLGNPASFKQYPVKDLNVAPRTVKISQVVVEVLGQQPTFARISQFVIEVLVSNTNWFDFGTMQSTTTFIATFEGLAYEELGVNDFDLAYLSDTAPKNAQSDSANYKLAQAFVPVADAVMYGGSVYVTKTGAPVDTLTIELQSDSAGTPSGIVLATTTLNLAALVAGVETEVPFVFALGASVTAGATYYLVSYRTGVTDAVNYWKISTDSGTSALAQLKEFS